MPWPVRTTCARPYGNGIAMKIKEALRYRPPARVRLAWRLGQWRNREWWADRRPKACRCQAKHRRQGPLWRYRNRLAWLRYQVAVWTDWAVRPVYRRMLQRKHKRSPMQLNPWEQGRQAKGRRRQGRNRVPWNPRQAREALAAREERQPQPAQPDRPKGYIRLTCHNLALPDSDPIPGYVALTLHGMDG